MPGPLGKLAKLADLKALIGTTETGHDALFLALLERASTALERAAGFWPGGLRRASRIDFPRDPWHTVYGPRMVRLPALPIESISSVKQAYTTATDAEFALTTALVQDVDYTIDADLGAIERINASWSLGPRHLRVAHTSGWADPARVRIALATATYTASTRTLTQTGAFAAYAFAPGDTLVITAGTGAALGPYDIAARTSNDAIVLAQPLAAVDLAGAGSGGDIASAWDGMIDPPHDAQQAVLAQALRWWLTRETAGGRQTARGDMAHDETPPHPDLIAAARRLARSPR